MGIIAFFKKAFADMKESTKAQHKVDKANLAAAKAEAKANWEEAKMTPAQRQTKMQAERDAQIAAANVSAVQIDNGYRLPNLVFKGEIQIFAFL